MAITITPDDVRELCDTSLPDSVIQLYIDSVINRIGACLEGNYDAATAQLVALNLIAFYTCGSQQGGQVTSEKAPNGASVNYSVQMTKEGLQSSPYGYTVYNMDTEGCWQSMVAKAHHIGVAGNPSRPLGYE